MEAKLREFAGARSFTVEQRFIYGLVDNVYVTITPNGNLLQIYFAMSCPVLKAEDAIKQALKQTKNAKIQTVKQSSESIVVTLRKTRKLLQVENMNVVLQAVISAAKENNVVPNISCVNCGKQTEDIALFADVACPLCASCVQKIEENNRSYKGSPVAYVTGIIGALLGALIGSIPWIVIYHLGWILSILAALIAVCSFQGYKLFRGPRKRGTASVIIYTSSIFASVASFVIYVFVLLKYYGYDAFSLHNYIVLFSDSEVITSIIIALVFALLGIAGIHKQISTYTIPKNAKLIAQRPLSTDYPVL